MAIKNLIFDTNRQEFVLSLNNNNNDIFTSLYQGDIMPVSLMFVTQLSDSASINNYYSSSLFDAKATASVALGTISDAGVVTLYTSSYLYPVTATSTYTGSLTISSPNLTAAMTNSSSISSFFQIKQLAPTYINTYYLTDTKFTIYKPLL